MCETKILTTHPRPRSSGAPRGLRPARTAAAIRRGARPGLHGPAGRCYRRKAGEGGGRCIGRTCRPPGETGPVAWRRIGKDSHTEQGRAPERGPERTHDHPLLLVPPSDRTMTWRTASAAAARDGLQRAATAYGFPASAFEMSVIARCARTLLPASSSGGETTAMPNLPGDTAMMPPPTPLFAGRPV